MHTNGKYIDILNMFYDVYTVLLHALLHVYEYFFLKGDL